MKALSFYKLNRPKAPQPETKRNPRFEEIELTNQLQQCKQIMRQDKIFIRAKIKQADPQVLGIFRKNRRQNDLKGLQINLRKYLLAIKTQFKMEQLKKFKENFQEFVSDKPQKPVRKSEWDGNSSSANKYCSKRKWFNESEGKENRENRSRATESWTSNKGKDKRAGSNERCKTNMYGTLRISEPLQDFDSCNLTGRPSCNSRKYCKTTTTLPNEQPQIVYPRFTTVQKPTNPTASNGSTCRKDTQTYWNQTLNRYMDERMAIEKQILHRLPAEDSIQQKLQNFSVNISQTQLDNGQTNIRLPTFEGDTYQQQLDTNQDFQERTPTTNETNLFTNPDILQECRKILKSKTNLMANSTEIKPHRQIEEPLFKSNIMTSSNKNTPQFFNQREKCREAASKPIQIDLEQDVRPTSESAEDIFDAFFTDYRMNKISRAAFQRTLHQVSAHLSRYQNLFDIADEDHDGLINARDLGVILDRLFQSKTNTVRDIFTLIDIQRNGYFTKSDFDKFLSQVLTEDTAQNQEIRLMADKIFKTADIGNNQRISYWALYFVKSMPEFVRFTNFLEQFEFEIET